MSVEYKVNGMTCGGCAQAVKKAVLAAIPEAQVEVELNGGLVRVQGGDDERVKHAVEDVGFEFAGRL